MSFHLHPLPVTLIPRDMPLASVWVPAGFPSPAADDLEETVDPMKWVVRHEHATFWWRVSGDSLEAEGILDGDLIAVDRAGRRRSGRIVLNRCAGSRSEVSSAQSSSRLNAQS